MKIKDFFNIEYGQHNLSSKKELENKKGKIPLISSKGKNNGIYGFYDINPEYKDVISVPRTGTICMAYYHDYSCSIDDNCLVLKPKNKMKIQELIFFVLLVRNEKYKYVYGRQVTPERLGGTEIPLFPKWIYDIKINLTELGKSVHKNILSLKNRRWKEFIYPEVFNLDKGYNNVAPKKEGNTPFISATRENNGVSFWCDIKELLKTFEGNCLTIVNDGNSMGETFYQPKSLIFGASHSINIVRLKDRELNPYIAMFLIPLIKKEKIKFHYGRKWRIERMRKSIIKLPINDKGNPDWEFMENYIKGLAYSKEV